MLYRLSRWKAILHAQVLATKSTPLASLYKGSLIVQNRQCLLQSINLGSSAPLSLFIGLWLGNAAIFDLRIIFVNGSQFRICRLAIGRHFGDALVEASEFLRLVFHILAFQSVRDFVFLGLLFILRSSITFFGFLFR